MTIFTENCWYWSGKESFELSENAIEPGSSFWDALYSQSHLATTKNNAKKDKK